MKYETKWFIYRLFDVYLREKGRFSSNRTTTTFKTYLRKLLGNNWLAIISTHLDEKPHDVGVLVKTLHEASNMTLIVEWNTDRLIRWLKLKGLK